MNARAVRYPLLILGLLLVLAAALLTYAGLWRLVFWPPAEAVRIPAAGVELTGTLVKPGERGVFPAIVVLHGSGPETRSEPSYRITVNALRRHGFAVLLYDKRGAGGSTGDFRSAAYRDFIEDAVAAVRYLAARPDIDGARIGLFGNSESGWFTPEIAARTQAAFVINRAGPPLSWAETVLWEVRNDALEAGVPETELEGLLALVRRRWAYYQATAANPALAEGAEWAVLNAAIAEARARVPQADAVLAERMPPYDAARYERLAANSAYDPRPYLESLDTPLLYLFGGQDINVPTTASVAFLEELRETRNKDITIQVWPDLGHSLLTWTGLLDGGYPLGYLELIGAWAANHAGLR